MYHRRRGGRVKKRSVRREKKKERRRRRTEEIGGMEWDRRYMRVELYLSIYLDLFGGLLFIMAYMVIMVSCCRRSVDGFS